MEVPDKSKNEVDELVIKAAETFRLDANLIRAIISVESRGNTWASRYESTTEKYVISTYEYGSKLHISEPTERYQQMTSWGLMQVMGFVARELYFQGYLAQLCIEELGIFYGCKKLRMCMDRYADEAKAIAAYNAGSAIATTGGMFRNQQYVDKVHQELVSLRGGISH